MPEQKRPFPEMEEEVLKRWEEKNIFEKTLKKDSPKGEFVFYEGPPTANGRPGIHHLEARAFKDAIPRYKTMRGYHVRRKGGWDTHGLPVEIQIEKKIGIKAKPEIEKYGIAQFNRLCQESVWEFKQIWDKFTERIGYWVDLKNPYVTYDTDYMESVWWILKKIWDKGLMEKDYKVVPYCARCGTPLSSHEVALGYEDVEETSVYLKFKVEKSGLPFDTAQGMPVDKDIYLLAWTTTPWTLPGNVALAVNPEIDYVFIKVNSGEVFILAKNRLSILSEKYEVIKEVKGNDLVGMRYEPLFDYFKNGRLVFHWQKLAFLGTIRGTEIFCGNIENIFLVTLRYLAGSFSKKIVFGKIFWASATLMPVFMPRIFASVDDATIQPLGERYAHTATGTPRKNGFACCSTEAK